MGDYLPSAPKVSWRQKLRILKRLKQRGLYTHFMVQSLRELSKKHLDEQLHFENQRHEKVVAVIHEFRRRHPGLAFKITEVNAGDRRGLDNIDILVMCLETHMREYLTNRKEGRSRKEKAGHWNHAPQGTPASDVLSPTTLSSPGTRRPDQGEGHTIRTQGASRRPRSTFPQPSARTWLLRTSSTPDVSAGAFFNNEMVHLRNDAAIADAAMYDEVYAALNAAATTNVELAPSSATSSDAGQCVGQGCNEALTMAKTGVSKEDVASFFDRDTYDGHSILPSSFRTLSPGPIDNEDLLSSPSITSSTQSSLSRLSLPWLADMYQSVPSGPGCVTGRTFLDVADYRSLDVDTPPTTIRSRTAGQVDHSAIEINRPLPQVEDSPEACYTWLHEILQRSEHACMSSDCGPVVTAATPLSEENWDRFEAFVREL